MGSHGLLRGWLYFLIYSGSAYYFTDEKCLHTCFMNGPPNHYVTETTHSQCLTISSRWSFLNPQKLFVVFA
jgi:hypothetical protein